MKANFQLCLGLFLWWLLTLLNHKSIAQQNVSTSKSLPFAIDASKRLPDFELTHKKEGNFVTGLPRFEFDPIRGIGAGGNLNLFFNKSKQDPFFAYTAYRHRIYAEFFLFENGRIRYALNYDAPYIFNSKWRIRADLVHWEDPNAQYWGIGRKGLDRLQFPDATTGEMRTFNRVKAYEANLNKASQAADGRYYTHADYHHLKQDEQLYNILGERTFWGGKLRLMLGYEALFTAFEAYGGQKNSSAQLEDGTQIEAINRPTLVEIEKANGTWERYNLAGFGNSEKPFFTSMLAAALLYDTRDFEPDPSKGIFIQYSHEYSAPWLGSEFNFHKFMVQGQFIHTFLRWRNQKNRLTFAGLAALGHIFGEQINFIEMWDLSSQAEAGGILVLGGARSIRGFREARFLAPTVALINLELRGRYFDFNFLKQHISIGSILFYDLGSVWDNPKQINLQKWVGAPGLGARISWNQSTVLRLDYGLSREGGQFFFGFGQIF